MKKWLLFLVMSIVMVIFAACTANEEAGEDPKEEPESTEDAKKEEGEEEGKVLHLNNGIEPTSLNPSIGFDQVSWDPLNNLMEGLTRLDEDSSAQAGVAEDWMFLRMGLSTPSISEKMRTGQMGIPSLQKILSML